jgi:hypothetical protein
VKRLGDYQLWEQDGRTPTVAPGRGLAKEEGRCLSQLIKQERSLEPPPDLTAGVLPAALFELRHRHRQVGRKSKRLRNDGRGLRRDSREQIPRARASTATRPEFKAAAAPILIGG